MKEHICVIGAGTMGRGIAQIALAAGHVVSLVDPEPQQLEAAAADAVERLTKRDPAARPALRARLNCHERIEQASPSQATVVVEAAVEDLSVKHSVLTRAAEHFGRDCILATNTSSLSITQIAAAVPRPERVVGMHFFNPVPVMRLVEVVAGVQTDPAVADRIADLARSWGKDVARAASAPGFIVNRVARPFYGEALRLLEEGAATHDQLDDLLRSAGGFRMGPFELMDLIGLEVNLAVTTTVWTAFNYDPRYAPSHIQRELVASGHLGRKSGRGFYVYSGGQREAREALGERGPLPVTPVLVGGAPQLQTLLDRTGVRFTRDARPSRGWIDLGSAGRILTTRGRTASEEALACSSPVALVDRCLDPESTDALAVTGTSQAVVDLAARLLAHADVRTVQVADTPGLVVARIVAMLANEAWEAVNQRLANPADIDTAMRLGTNYPLGPVEWSQRWGTLDVVEILDALWDEYRDGRYRASHALRAAVRGADLTG